MDIQVKEVSFKEDKSVQEIEKELLEKHEQQHQEPAPTPDPVPPSEDELLEKEKDVLSYIGKRYNKEINSLDELFAAREQNEELLTEYVPIGHGEHTFDEVAFVELLLVPA